MGTVYRSRTQRRRRIAEHLQDAANGVLAGAVGAVTLYLITFAVAAHFGIAI